MPLPRTRASELMRRLTALGLVAWFAGAGCVLGCSAAAARHHDASSQTPAAHDGSHAAARPDSCAAMSGHDCCAGGGREEAGAAVLAGTHGSRTAMHCPLGGRQASDPARKVRVDTTPTASAPAAQSPAPGSSYVPPSAVAGWPARDRGGTHLRCCVFLI